ncbi:phosphoribosylglycinamide formyltransferase [Ornithinibacillus sp. L9]|uniref:Phosphoribosylglycinamide formyltransferase n=1 Tax=Ornithinibacillus caprae TaxID=2678566 RepID=A0A6N8FGV1_9BACI|nr:phosphoribosylglycinamide formyltransferase [Ornithinibacillus caprae]MUK88441.1 phosphoribosylglycinamide formyltransferase [Ornithinibacillus caprae]
MKMKAAVFASGTGSNFQALLDTDDLTCEISLLVCDQPGAAVIEKASKAGIPIFLFNPKDYDSKEAYEKEILRVLENRGVSWIFLAGYMRIVGSTLLHAYEGKIVNIHPSLLPSFPGKDAIGQAFQAGVETTGVTVHYIDEGIDTGPIIAQEVVEILPTDTQDSLTKRIQQVEHQLYPKVINELLS